MVNNVKGERMFAMSRIALHIFPVQVSKMGCNDRGRSLRMHLTCEQRIHVLTWKTIEVANALQGKLKRIELQDLPTRFQAMTGKLNQLYRASLMHLQRSFACTLCIYMELNALRTLCEVRDDLLKGKNNTERDRDRDREGTIQLGMECESCECYGGNAKKML